MEKPKQMFLKVETFDKHELLSVREIDYYSYEARKWLAKHCWWAMHQGYSVTTYPQGEQSNGNS